MASCFLVTLLACASVATAYVKITNTVPLTVPNSQPPFAKPLRSNLVGSSLEFQFWPAYAGNATGQPSKYVNQLLRNIGERMGKSPALRAGGNCSNALNVQTLCSLWCEHVVYSYFRRK